MSRIPPEAYEHLAAMEDCVRRLRMTKDFEADPDLAEKVRRLIELTAELRKALQGIDREGHNGA